LAEFKNPQQESGMERRLLIVFALTFLVIMLFQPLLKKYGPQPPAKPQTTAQRSTGQPEPAAAPTQSSAQRTPDFVPPGIKVIHESAPLQATTESETVIENDVYRIVFTNRGARVKSWVLKKYTDDKGGQLELVNATASEKYGFPLTLWTYDEELRNKVNSALYVGSHVVTRTDTAGASPLGASYTAPTEVVFGYSDAVVTVRMTYSFDASS
jgi:YidC/Oxa1 family membrane protein insertase